MLALLALCIIVDVVEISGQAVVEDGGIWAVAEGDVRGAVISAVSSADLDTILRGTIELELIVCDDGANPAVRIEEHALREGDFGIARLLGEGFAVYRRAGTECL